MIGKILRTMRRESNLSQMDISKHIQFARNTISQYETGEIQPTFETIEKIAKLCGFNIIFVNEEKKIILSSDNIDREEI